MSGLLSFDFRAQQSVHPLLVAVAPGTRIA